MTKIQNSSDNTGVMETKRTPKNPACPKGHAYDEENTAYNARGDYYCRSCKREGASEWRRKQREKDPERLKRWSRESAARVTKRLRAESVEAYGGKCVCCGEKEPLFLHLDHVNNDGAAHRRELFGEGRGGNSLATMRWAKNNNWPNILQLKCHNCGMAEGFYGRCPHNGAS